MGITCGCAVTCDDNYDEDQRWGCRGIRAAKEHKCSECSVIIPIGSSFFYHTVFFEGSCNNYKICQDCQSVILHFFGDGWWFGSVWDHLAEYLYYNWRDDLPSSCISQLTPTARDKVCDLLQGEYEDENP